MANDSKAATTDDNNSSSIDIVNNKMNDRINESNSNDATNKIQDSDLNSISSSIATGIIDHDEKLKNDIINFNRSNYVYDSSSIKDPFIYTYPKTKEETDFINKARQVKLILYGILDDRAKINGYWVSKNDSVDGWIVADIQKDQVKLKFMTDTRVLHVNSNSNIKIK